LPRLYNRSLPAQVRKPIRRPLVELHQFPIAEDGEKLTQTDIGWKLPMYLAQPMNDGQSPAKYFLHAHDRASNRFISRFHPCI
jgi:hypothetical protein